MDIKNNAFFYTESNGMKMLALYPRMKKKKAQYFSFFPLLTHFPDILEMLLLIIWDVFKSSLNRLFTHLMASLLRLTLSIDFSSLFPH